MATNTTPRLDRGHLKTAGWLLLKAAGGLALYFYLIWELQQSAVRLLEVPLDGSEGYTALVDVVGYAVLAAIVFGGLAIWFWAWVYGYQVRTGLFRRVR